MDLRMPRMDGVEATKRIRAEHPETQVVVLTTYADDESIVGALRAGQSDTSPRTPAETISAAPSKPPPRANRCSTRWSRPDLSRWLRFQGHIVRTDLRPVV